MTVNGSAPDSCQLSIDAAAVQVKLSPADVFHLGEKRSAAAWQGKIIGAIREFFRHTA